MEDMRKEEKTIEKQQKALKGEKKTETYYFARMVSPDALLYTWSKN